jgi:hypothetical protein
MNIKRALILLAKLLVTAGLLALMYRRLSVVELGESLAGLRPLPVALFMVLLLANTALSAWKWKLLLKADGVDLPFRRLLVSYLIGSFFNMFLPSTIGGDAYRVASEGRGDRLAKSFSSVFADRLSGFVALTSLGLAAALIGFRLIRPPGLIWIPALLCLGFLTMALLMMNRPWAEALFRLARLDRVGPLWRPISKCLGSFDLYRKTPGLLPRIMAISFLFQALVVVCIWLLGQALQIPVPLSRFFIFVPLVSILEAVPISIYGVGLRDAGYLLLFTQAGLPNPQVPALSISVLYLACTVVYASFGGLLFLRRLFMPAASAAAD